MDIEYETEHVKHLAKSLIDAADKMAEQKAKEQYEGQFRQLETLQLAFEQVKNIIKSRVSSLKLPTIKPTKNENYTN